MKYFRQKTSLLLVVLLMTTATATSTTVQADPLGQLVNLLMNKILSNAEQKKKDETQYRSTSPSAFRNIPKDSKTGVLSPPEGNQIEIDGDDYQLAFNSRIKDEGNRILQIGMIQQPTRIRYTLNSQEQVDKIWLLASGEK